MGGPKLLENEKKQRSIFLSKTLRGEWQSGVKGDFYIHSLVKTTQLVG